MGGLLLTSGMHLIPLMLTCFAPCNCATLSECLAQGWGLTGANDQLISDHRKEFQRELFPSKINHEGMWKEGDSRTTPQPSQIALLEFLHPDLSCLSFTATQSGGNKI